MSTNIVMHLLDTIGLLPFKDAFTLLVLAALVTAAKWLSKHQWTLNVSHEDGFSVQFTAPKPASHKRSLKAQSLPAPTSGARRTRSKRTDKLPDETPEQ